MPSRAARWAVQSYPDWFANHSAFPIPSNMAMRHVQLVGHVANVIPSGIFYWPA